MKPTTQVKIAKIPKIPKIQEILLGSLQGYGPIVGPSLLSSSAVSGGVDRGSGRISASRLPEQVLIANFFTDGKIGPKWKLTLPSAIFHIPGPPEGAAWLVKDFKIHPGATHSLDTDLSCRTLVGQPL